jgi:hypothetical protein
MHASYASKVTLQRCNIEKKTSRNAGRVRHIAVVCSRSRMHYFDLLIIQYYERFEHDHFSASVNFSFSNNVVSVSEAAQSDGALLL